MTSRRSAIPASLLQLCLLQQCHLMSVVWFRALSNYEYAMRVDEDVCLTRLPSQAFLAALSANYAFGLDTVESHFETVDTFSPWLEGYMTAAAVQPTMPPLPTNRIFFSNFFVSRIDWWVTEDVQRFLDAVNRSGGIYRFRWGDAPIQTAALRLHAPPGSVHHIAVDYVQ